MSRKIKSTELLAKKLRACKALLNEPNKGILIESFIWREMFDFTDDCVLLVLADAVYNEDDYIRDYVEFLEYIK